MGTALARAAGPGALDPGFAPELRAPAIPVWTLVGPDGHSWVGGGFDRADGNSSGDLLVLGENGGISREPAPGYLAPDGFYGRAPFPLADGSFLLPADSGGWLRLNADGTPAGPAFPGLAAGESLVPQFEREGKLWVIRVPPNASGKRTLERRESADGSIDPTFSQGTDWPDDVLDAVPDALGGAWVLTGDHGTSSGLLFPDTEPADQHVFLVHGSGAVAGEMRVLSGYRPATLAPGADGGVVVVLGEDLSRWFYWPAPDHGQRTIEWRSAEGAVLRSKHLAVPFIGFAWAAGEEGALVATDAFGDLRRYDAAGNEDENFISPGKVRHVAALPGGKWLIDGVRRLNADGSPDSSWIVPDIDQEVGIHELHAMPGGKVLAHFAAGDPLSGSASLFLVKSDGTFDPNFVLDARVETVGEVAVQGDAIYLITYPPVQLDAKRSSGLVKLRSDGSVDEDYFPIGAAGVANTTFSWSPPPGVNGGVVTVPFNLAGSDLGNIPIIVWDAISMNGFAGVHPLSNGQLLVETFTAMEVPTHSVIRLNSDGTRDSAFDFGIRNFNSLGSQGVLALKNGGMVIGSRTFAADASLVRDLSGEGRFYRPLCEWQQGVLFLEGKEGESLGRLRIWKGGKWANTFNAPRIDAMNRVIATRGENGTLYVYSSAGGGRPALRRLLANGKVDRSFRSAVIGKRERREGGPWWQAGEAGKLSYNVAAAEKDADISSMLWQASTGRLWIGGSFNVVDGQPRDGLAQIFGGRKIPAVGPRR